MDPLPDTVDADLPLESLRDPAVTFAREFDASEHPLPVGAEVRELCLQNYCGMCGRNWGCPPNTPPVEECAALIGHYPRFIVVRTSYPRDGPFDPEGTLSSAKAHFGLMCRLRDEARGAYGDCLVLGAGGCLRCDECTCPDAPCRYPDGMLPSLESRGVDITSFRVREGIGSGSEGGTRHAWFGLVLH